jgi:hypothetical protein
MDNRGCFHAASVLTTFLIGGFAALEKESPRYVRIVKEHPHKSPHSVAENGVLPGSCCLYVFEKFGSSGRIRTYNPSVNSRMLYR